MLFNDYANWQRHVRSTYVCVIRLLVFPHNAMCSKWAYTTYMTEKRKKESAVWDFRTFTFRWHSKCSFRFVINNRLLFIHRETIYAQFQSRSRSSSSFVRPSYIHKNTHTYTYTQVCERASEWARAQNRLVAVHSHWIRWGVELNKFWRSVLPLLVLLILAFALCLFFCLCLILFISAPFQSVHCLEMNNEVCACSR